MRTFLTLCLSILSIVALSATKNISGTWHVTTNASMKLIFTSKGTFKFVGSNYSSSGTYRVNGDEIDLLWTKVDGEAVKSGSMHRTLTVTPDNTLIIDRYTYSR